MQRIIILSIIVLILALLLPLIFVSPPEAQTDEPAQVSDEGGQDGQPEAETETQPPANYTLNPDVPEGEIDSGLTLKVLVGDTVQEMDMSVYLQGVVAAEMPVSFELEALKAQAVAARTYTLYKMLVEPSARHPDAHVCDDYTCCSAYKTQETLMEQWGENYQEYSQIIAQAVAQTDGVCMLYDGQPLLAAFHSSSDGATEASGAIWSDLPYLQSVRTFESEDEVPNLFTAVEMTYSEFRETVQESYPDAVLEDESPSGWIRDLSYNDSGRLASVNVGGVTLTGAQVRTLFSLRSTAITFESTDDGITITTSGYGHGVGMSQYGANTMARLGLEYSEILQWYYTDITLSSMDVLFPQ